MNVTGIGSYSTTQNKQCKPSFQATVKISPDAEKLITNTYADLHPMFHPNQPDPKYLTTVCNNIAGHFEGITEKIDGILDITRQSLDDLKLTFTAPNGEVVTRKNFPPSLLMPDSTLNPYGNPFESSSEYLMKANDKFKEIFAEPIAKINEKRYGYAEDWECE